MDRNSRIYNFGPDGRDACWAALSSSWGRCSNQQGSFNSRSVNSCRSTKKTSVFKTSLSPRPQPPPSSSPRVLKRKSGVLQPLTNNQLSTSVEVIKPTILEPPSINDQCNCSQSGYSELSVVNSVTSNNNNNNDNDQNNQKYGVLETIDAVNQKQQQLVCVADSRSSIDITEPVTVYAEKPVLELQNECDDPILSVSRPPTPSTANKQPIESAQQIKGDNVTSMSCPLAQSNTVEQTIESVQQIEDDNVSFISCQLTSSTTVEQQIESVQQVEDDNVSFVSCPLVLSIAVEQQNESVQKIEGDIVSSVSCPLTVSTTAEQQTEIVQQIKFENVSSVSCPLTMFIAIEQEIERIQRIESDQVLSTCSLLYPSIVVEQPVAAKNSMMMEVVVANHDKVSPVLSPQFPLMTSATENEDPKVLHVVSSSQPKDGNDSPVQSNTDNNQTNGMMVLSDQPELSKYEMKIKEIDNNIISYSKSILCTVLVVVLLRVLF